MGGELNSQDVDGVELAGHVRSPSHLVHSVADRPPHLGIGVEVLADDRIRDEVLDGEQLGGKDDGMRRMTYRGRRPRPDRDSEAWLVFIGRGPTDDSLTLAAVTGSRHEADALLARGFHLFPDRSNEVASYPYISDLTEDGSGTDGIAAGERRMVFVLATGEEWYEVHSSRQRCERREDEMVASGLTKHRRLEVATNTWIGPVGSDFENDGR